MTFQIALLLGFVATAMALFWWERFPADVVALGLLLALVGAGLLPMDKAFAGFGSDTVIMMLGLLILTAALRRTGVVDLVASAVLRHAGDGPDRLLWAIMLTSAGIGAFISNTASTAFFLPMVFGIARKTNVSPSKLLMPLAFSGIVTSSVTLISTSTNLVVSGLMSQYGMRPLSMFELAPVGLPIAIIGLLYMFFIGRRLIPDRAPVAEMTEEFGVRPYLSELVIQPGSSLAGKALGKSNFGRSTGLNILRIIREDGRHVEARAHTMIEPGDILLVEGRQEDIVKIKDTAGVEIKADVHLSDPDLQDDEMGLVEVIVPPGSPLIGSTLKTGRFRDRYGLQVLGLNHRGINVVQELGHVPIQLGDVLLVQGRRHRLARLAHDSAFQILGPMEPMEEARPRRRHALTAIGIFTGVIALVTFGVMPLALAAMLGVLLVFITGCITPERAYREVDWKVIVLLGSLLGLSVAMDKSGTAAYLARVIVSFAGEAHPLWLLSGFFALTVVLTQPMSNQAAAIVVLPIAIQTASQLGLNPRTFAVMIAVAASCSYLTPLEPACLMVYGPGRYRFADFLKVGAGLTLLIYLVAIVCVPWFWPLKN
jgi:di/tricarboxylate transporter